MREKHIHGRQKMTSHPKVVNVLSLVADQETCRYDKLGILRWGDYLGLSVGGPNMGIPIRERSVRVR